MIFAGSVIMLFERDHTPEILSLVEPAEPAERILC
jgi:hypothetical protein